MLQLFAGLWYGDCSERMRLPDTQAWKAEVEMLSGLPWLAMVVVKVEPHHNIVIRTEAAHCRLSTMKADTCPFRARDVKTTCAKSADALVDGNECQACDHL